MARLRAAVIGLGRMGSTFDEEIPKYGGLPLPHSHIGSFMAVPEVELVGLADGWEEQREAARRKWSFEAIYGDYRQMLQETKPDIVSVCTNAKPRAEIMLEIANGDYGVKAIWAEKPITFSLEQADRVIEVYRREGIALAMNAGRCWAHTYRQALEMLKDGILGDLLHVSVFGIGNMSHMGSHYLTNLTMFVDARASWVVGEAESDEAVAGDLDFQATGYLGFPNGVRGYFRSMFRDPTGWSVDVTGTHGMIRLMQDGNTNEVWTLGEPLPGQRGQAPMRRFFPPARTQRSCGVSVVHDLLHCIQTGADPKCSGEDAREALEIAIAIRESHRRGNVRVDLPLADRSLQIISSEARSDVPRVVQRRREAEQAGRR